MKKQLHFFYRKYLKVFLIGTLLIGFAESAKAQSYLWYRNSTNTKKITFNLVANGSFTTNVINPNTVGNTNATVTRIIRAANSGTFVTFDLRNNLTNIANLQISLDGFIAKVNLTNKNRIVRVYLKNSQLGSTGMISVGKNFSSGQSWEAFNFDFSNATVSNAVLAAGGFDQLMVGLGTGDTSASTTTYYLDNIRGTIDLDNPPGNNAFPAAALSGSWGVRHLIAGGSKLDNNNDYRAGATEIVNELPSVGHIITNMTHPAHGYHFTLRTNPYINVATEINPDFVPSLADEQIIIDVINIYKAAGKKVILYIAGDGPSATGGTPNNATYKADWENYYRNSPLYTGTWAEKEGQAWRLLCKGYIERFAALGVDGYWIDHVAQMPGEIGDFVAMVRDTHPGAILTLNAILDNGLPDSSDAYIRGNNGNYLWVDTDNSNEIVGNTNTSNENRDYKVKSFGVTDPYSDFANGHPTPLALGAPPSSWAYEEFSFQEMVDEPWDSYDGSKLSLTHAWIPMRNNWTNASNPLQFGVEKAYRFVRTLTDAGAAITWGNTSTNGQISDDEMAIMEEIDRRFNRVNKIAYIPYNRPNGAYLRGESTSTNLMASLPSNLLVDTEVIEGVSLYPNPVKESFRISGEGISKAVIYDMSGTKVLEFTGDQDAFDVSGLNNGIYFLKTMNGSNEVETIRFIKE